MRIRKAGREAATAARRAGVTRARGARRRQSAKQWKGRAPRQLRRRTSLSRRPVSGQDERTSMRIAAECSGYRVEPAESVEAREAANRGRLPCAERIAG